MSEPAPGEASAGRLYKRLWRWHFWAAFLVIPFVLLQAITGTLYLWQDAWADGAHPALRFAAAGTGAATLEAQVNAALAAVLPDYPGARPSLLVLPEDPARSTTVLFTADNGLQFPAFVDPHSAEVLGVVGPWSWMPGWTLALHGGWPLGKPGSWLLELGACWCMVMIASGLYLWWPRGISLGRALLPRLSQGQRVFWRDLHACVAVWFSLLTLCFLFTALPWTDFWGGQILKPVQKAVGQAAPPSGAQGLRSQLLPGTEPMSLEEAVTLARDQGLRGTLELRFAFGETDALSIRNRMPKASEERQLAADRYSRELLRNTGWESYKLIPRVVATGVDLHEGTYFGRANQWLNTTLSVALIWVSLSGLLSWWLRRPGRKGLQAPPRSAGALPRWLRIAAVFGCVVLPLLGASVLVLLLLDALTRKLWPATAV